MGEVLSGSLALLLAVTGAIAAWRLTDLLGEVLPDFKLAYDLESGMEELHKKMVEHGFSAADFEGDQFVRLRTLSNRMNMLAA